MMNIATFCQVWCCEALLIGAKFSEKPAAPYSDLKWGLFFEMVSTYTCLSIQKGEERFYQITRRHIPQGCDIHIHRYDKINFTDDLNLFLEKQEVSLST
jgi:hypothetical protein